MSNISRIQLSGVSYDIKDANSPRVVTLTQAEFAALGTKDSNTLYVISDAEPSTGASVTVDAALDATSNNPVANSAVTNAISAKVDTSTYNTYTAATDTSIASKQDALTAGDNITISNNVISANVQTITVDDALSESSTNPVQNNVIYAAIGNIETLLSNI